MQPDALICTKFKKVEWNGNHSVNNGPVKRLTNSACLQVYMSNDHTNFRTYFTKKLSAPTGSFQGRRANKSCGGAPVPFPPLPLEVGPLKSS